jgi:predicted phage terminase large subunit-like protein
LLDLWRKRAEFPQLKRELTALAEKWRPSAILIENAASGQSLIQELKHETRLPILAVKVDSDKVTRAHAASPLVEAGKVFLPKSAPWLNDFLSELSQFPVAPHDDIADSVTQALNWMGRQGQNGLFNYYADEAEKVKEASAPPPAPPKPRVWSEQIRTIGMGIPALADPDELTEWIAFLEGIGDGERLAFARTQRTEEMSATVQ